MPIRNQPEWLTDARTLPLIQGSAEVLLSLVPDQHVGTAETARQRRAETAAKPPLCQPRPRRSRVAAASTPEARQKAYGASDRRALDRLIEATGNGGSDKP